MTIPPRLAIATRNPGKVREFLQICADWPASWITFRDADWPVVAETGATYVDNARLKARAVAGEEATDDQNLQLLVDGILDAPADRRTARYRCVALCAWPEGADVWAEATCEGTLVTAPRGSNGFGYDPIFVPLGERRTMAELPDEEKHRISHRGKALRALGAMLADRSEPPDQPT